MNVGRLVREAIDKMMAKDAEHALIQAMIAVDATAKLTYRSYAKKNESGKRFRQFIDDNMELLTRATFVRGGILGGPAFFECDHPDLGCAPGNLYSFGDILYGLRCHLLHEARLADYVQLTDELKIGAGNPLVLTNHIVYGLLAIVIAAPVNRTQYIPPRYTIRARTKTRKVAAFWGAGTKLLDWFRSA
jgi:hypothetical protein